MRHSLKHILQFEVNSKTKSNNSYNSKMRNVVRCQIQFKFTRLANYENKYNTVQIKRKYKKNLIKYPVANLLINKLN